MELLYIPQLDDSTTLDTQGRYRLLRRVPESGEVMLTDMAVTRVEAQGESLRCIVPSMIRGLVRDFFLRVVSLGDTPVLLEVAAPEGETISFEDTTDDLFCCETGVNIFAFTETDEGIFIVRRKIINIDHVVEFDPCGGTIDRTSYVYKLGAEYGTLPTPTRIGYRFLGWFTATEGGVQVVASDRCKSEVSKLYAQWEMFDDPYRAYICLTDNLTFFSADVIPWTIDTDTKASGLGSARSGAIAHSGRTSLMTTCTGEGTFSFKWKVSSEVSYDKLHFIVDGLEVANIDGEHNWSTYTHNITGSGEHIIEWKYDKDGTQSRGSDCGWVDDVAWAPAEVANASSV